MLMISFGSTATGLMKSLCSMRWRNVLGGYPRQPRRRQWLVSPAESLSRLFLRNAVAVGLPALVCVGVHDAFVDGDGIEIDLVSGRVANVESGSDLQGDSRPEEMRETLAAGGILGVLRAQGGT